MRSKLMKPILLCMFLVILFSLLVSAAPAPYPIFGIITLDGVRAHGMQIDVENTVTSEVLTRYLVNGEFVLDGTEFHQGWSSNHLFKITYCVDDSRCREVSQTFNPTGSRSDLSRDLPVEPRGLAGPFIVHGVVTKDGNLVKKEDISIANLDKQQSEIIETNKQGEYEWNLATWGRYDTGDRVQVCYESHCIEGTVRNMAPGMELNLNVVTPSPEEGGGNGGNGGILGKPTEPTKPVEPKDPIEPIEPIEPVEPKEPKQPDKPVEPVEIPWKFFVGFILLVAIGAVIYGGYRLWKR